MRRTVVGWGMLVAVVAGVGACGEPDNNYIEHSSTGLFMRLPNDWETFQVLDDDPSKDPRVDPDGGAWRIIFDAAVSPDRSHLEEPAPGDPVGFVEIDPTPGGTGLTSQLEMRSLLTTGGSESQLITMDPLENPDFDVQDYEEFDLGGFYGNRLTVDTDGGDGDIRITQIVAVDSGSDRLYVTRLLCSVECYDDHADEIDDVLDSFTLEVS